MISSFTRRNSTMSKGAILALMLALALPLGSQSVDARAGGGFGFGSRGTRTFSMPAPTATAPRPAQPIQRSETPSANYGNSGFGSTAQPRRFGFGTGLAAGLLGAGLFGMLTGNGFFGGLGDLASLLGLVFQVALIGGLIWMALRFFRSRANPAFAGMGAGQARRDYAGTGGFQGATQPSRTVKVEPPDFAAFERSLVGIQDAYGREDMDGLSRLATSEMLRNFASDIEDNRRKGLRNDVSGARLLQGDLSEAWSEGASDYATVAMRFATLDRMVDRASGRVVSGNPAQPSEATELWTFRRNGGGPWLLSAIQQAA